MEDAFQLAVSYKPLTNISPGYVPTHVTFQEQDAGLLEGVRCALLCEFRTLPSKMTQQVFGSNMNSVRLVFDHLKENC